MNKKDPPGFTLIEVLIAIAIIAALSAIGTSVSRSVKQRANQASAMQKMKALGAAFATYTVDKNGLLPFEDAAGTDNWTNAAKPESRDAWYNALPRLMGARGVGEIGMKDPAELYSVSHPLYIPGAPYPTGAKRLAEPSFAVAMNSRLQREDEDGVKRQGRLAHIEEPSRTVVLLERGLPKDKKTMPAQRGFNGSPKAKPRAFAARHNQKGCLIFADGHAELHAASDLMTEGGEILTPQTSIVWTFDPDEDPN